MKNKKKINSGEPEINKHLKTHNLTYYYYYYFVQLYFNALRLYANIQKQDINYHYKLLS